MDIVEERIFDEIYQETYEDILKYVVLNCRFMNDVDDVMQNIYLSVYKAIKKNKAINRLYVFGIAKNKIKDYYRFSFRKKESFIDDENVIAISDEDLEKITMMKIESDNIFSYLQKKDYQTFEIFFFYFKENNTLDEIAQLLNISVSQVKNKLYRTLKELRSIYKEEE